MNFIAHPKKDRGPKRRRFVAAATTLALLATAGVASADKLHLDSSTISRSSSTNWLDVTTGTSTVSAAVGYRLEMQHSDGCDVSSTDPGTLALSGLPTGVSIASGATFTGCQTDGTFQEVTLHVASTVVAGSYVVAPSMTRQSGGGDFSPANNAGFTLRIADGTPPIITETVTPAPPNGDNGWYKSGDVEVSFAVTDPNSTVSFKSAPCDAVTTFSTDSGTHAVTCTATSAGGTGDKTVNVKRDVTAPLVAITSPADNADTAATSVTVSGTASDATSGLLAGGIKVNTVDVAVSGGTWSSEVSLACGNNAITAAAKDSAGNTASSVINVIRTCSSAYDIIGFDSPVTTTENGATPSASDWNTLKGGRTVPLKFEVFDGTTELTATTVVSSFKAFSVSCAGAVQSGELNLLDDSETTTGSTSLRYDPADGGQFIQNWKTVKVSADTCYRVEVKVTGDYVQAYFKLTK